MRPNRELLPIVGVRNPLCRGMRLSDFLKYGRYSSGTPRRRNSPLRTLAETPGVISDLDALSVHHGLSGLQLVSVPSWIV